MDFNNPDMIATEAVQYASYRNNLVYNSQQKINFPKIGDDPSNKIGEGSLIYLLCPNRKQAVQCIEDPVMNFGPSLTKRLITDSTYREVIGSKKITSMERSKTDKFFLEQKDLPLFYIAAASRGAILSKKKNCVYDLSRWMELIFTRTASMSPKKKCATFLRILKARLTDPAFNGYTKLIVIDINSWVQSIKSCVIMNRKLLNNPLSILLYSAVYFPDLLEDFPDVRLMIINRASTQVFLLNASSITKKTYPKLKSKLTKFKDLVFSVEDEVNPSDNEDEIDAEVKAEIVDSYKEDLKATLRHNLLGNSTEDHKEAFADIDITGDVADPFDELDRELAEAEDEKEEKASKEKRGPKPKEDKETIPDDGTDSDQITPDLNLTDEISSAVDEAFETVDDVESIDPNLLAARLADKIKLHSYKASFMPQRSEAEQAKIDRLTADQRQVLYQPTLDDVKRKSISTSTTGGFIKTTNPHILSSKFVNFDREYAEKNLEKNIDDSVGMLANASAPIFVTSKEVTDSSDPQNLKEEYTYHLVDEKGNKMRVSFDVPKIIDGSYVYLNGTKKNIRHQLILKPIVKTSPDTVQIVTAYNKVFIRREGAVNQNINRLEVFIEKNASAFRTKFGNCSMRNSAYEVPLDFAMLSRYFAEFTLDGITFFMSIDTLKDRYKKQHGKALEFDETKVLPIGIHTRTHEVVYMDLTASYTETILSHFTEEDRKKISAIKRKPRFVMATAKILRRVLPLVLLMMYCEGFASVMKKAQIKYEFVNKQSAKKYDPMKFDTIELADGFIIWEKTPFRNELLMNGFKKCDLTDFTFEDLESKDTFISLIYPFYPGNTKIADALDNYRDFLIDEKTKEILTDLGYPTDLVSLLVVAAGLLTDTRYIIENNLNNMRIRSNEIIADLVYEAITTAYRPYRNTQYKKKPTKLSIKKSYICDRLISSDVNMIEESSTLNPVLELEKQRSVTFKGMRGIQLDRAMTLPRRCYDQSMLGTLGISTSAKLDRPAIW